jgi:hypothetical protein
VRSRWRLTSHGRARILALAICIGIGLAFVIANVRSWDLEDADAYWNAAQRLRIGQPLYIPVDPGADEMVAYRYAPWFAWAWVPLTYLPKHVVQIAWSAVLIAASAVALAPLVRMRSAAAVCLLFLLGGLLIRTASTGNVHALMMAALVWGVSRRSAPFWIGVAASLKVVPILFALVLAGRGEWRRTALAIGVAALLWLPAAFLSLGSYPAEAGESLSLLSIVGPIPWLVAAAVVTGVAFRLAKTRYAWAAASAAVIAAVPRLAFYDLTYLLVATPAGSGRTTEKVAAGDQQEGHVVIKQPWGSQDDGHRGRGPSSDTPGGGGQRGQGS